MAISVKCQECGKRYRVDDEKAGRRIKCRNCGTVITIPMADPVDASPQAKRSLDTNAKPQQHEEVELTTTQQRWIRRAIFLVWCVVASTFSLMSRRQRLIWRLDWDVILVHIFLVCLVGVVVIGGVVLAADRAIGLLVVAFSRKRNARNDTERKEAVREIIRTFIALLCPILFALGGAFVGQMVKDAGVLVAIAGGLIGGALGQFIGTQLVVDEFDVFVEGQYIVRNPLRWWSYAATAIIWSRGEFRPHDVFSDSVWTKTDCGWILGDEFNVGATVRVRGVRVWTPAGGLVRVRKRLG